MVKGKAIALVAIFAAIGLVTATGAFTTVSAERTATVSVAGDSSALVGLAPYNGPNGHPNGGNAGYAKLNGGTLEINLNGYNTQGTGVNLNAKTEINNVFNITNNGAQDVTVYIVDNEVNTTGNNNIVQFHNGTVDGTDAGSIIEGKSNAMTLTTGETVTISIQIDTTLESLTKDDQILDGITVYANSTSTA